MRLPYEISPDRPPQVGLIVLQADETLENDMRRLLPPDLEYLVSRVPSGTEVSTDTLRAMEGALTTAASLFPAAVKWSAVGYGCTSAAAEIGADLVAEHIRAGVQTPAVTEPVSALISACNRLKLNRIALISPYVASVSDRLRDVLEQAGISVTDFASFEEPVEANVVRISPGSILQAAVEMGRKSDCDAVFLSCTNLRTLDVIDSIEQQIGKPVLSSNQVLAWDLCRLAGINLQLGGFGRLLAP